MMKIIGIDPAPGKSSTVFDGSVIKEYSGRDLEFFLSQLSSSDQNVIISWDAPLTGPANPDELLIEGDLTYRILEKYIVKETKKVVGVSTQPYSGCPHWTITKRFLGLPILGKLDNKILPFALHTKDFKKEQIIKGVVEVHPVLAINCWAEESFEKYKGAGRDINSIESIKGALKKQEFLNSDDSIWQQIKTDGDLDTFVAYKLLELYLNNKGNVILFGNESGSILMPESDVYNNENYNQFFDKELNKRNKLPKKAPKLNL